MLYDRIYQMLKVRTVVPDLVVYLHARTEVLLDRIRHRARRGEAHPGRIRRRGGARPTREYFFAYNDGPLLIVNASDIDFVGNAEHRRSC